MSEQQPQHIVSEACKYRFENLEKALEELKSSSSKSSDWIVDMREIIVKLTVIQEQQQKSLENQQRSLEDQQQALQDQADAQNKMLRELMELEKARQSREETYLNENANKKELSAKKIIALTTIVAAIISAIGNIISTIAGK